MTEAEFRDFMRRNYGSIDDRLKAVEAKVMRLALAPPRIRSETIGAVMASLAARLVEEVHGGRVTALAITFVTDDGIPHTGWSSEAFERYALAGAVDLLWLEVMKGEEDETDASGEVGPGVRQSG